jgi:hypothetical protein
MVGAGDIPIAMPLIWCMTKVSKLHPVVSHHKGHGRDYCLWVLVVDAVELLGTPQVFLDLGDAFLHSNVTVHDNCIVRED